MTGLLQDKVVLITGAGGGIGGAAALLFAQEGARVVASDIDEARLQATLDRLESGGFEAAGVVSDVTGKAGAAAIVARGVETFGRLDGAFNNAGMSAGQSGMVGRRTHEWDESAFDLLLSVNLKSVWLCMVEQIEQMLKQGQGTIVNTASVASHAGFRTTCAYTAAKHGVLGLTRAAALEYAPTLKINAVCPGYTDTALLASSMARRGDEIVRSVPAGRIADPLEAAQAACWLMSDRSSYAVGAGYLVDGGLLAGF